MWFPLKLAEYMRQGYSYVESLRTNYITSLSDRAQQIPTLLTTTNKNNLRLLLVAACKCTGSCNWLVEILRALPGFSVANSCRVDEIVPTLFALSASTLDSLLQRLVGGARKVVIQMFTHINKHSVSSITALLQTRMCRLDMMISRNLPPPRPSPATPEESTAGSSCKSGGSSSRAIWHDCTPSCVLRHSLSPTDVQQGACGQMQRQLLQHCQFDRRFPPGESQMSPR